MGEVCRLANFLKQGKLSLQNISEVLLNSPKLVELIKWNYFHYMEE